MYFIVQREGPEIEVCYKTISRHRKNLKMQDTYPCRILCQNDRSRKSFRHFFGTDQWDFYSRDNMCFVKEYIPD